MGQSGSNSEDALGGLINKARSRRAGAKPATATEQTILPKPSGLRPSEILFLPADQKKLVGYLSRQRHARFKDMQQVVDMESQQILKTLSDLKDNGYINEVLQDGEIYYRVKFVETSKTVGRNLPKEIRDALNLDNATFLLQSPLFKNLTEVELNRIQQSILQEHYERNDVILWQGEAAKAFSMIKNGVVAVTNLSSDGTPNLITYLEQGDFFGESSLLTGQATNATITAFTPTDILVINQDDFFSLVSRHSERTLELAKILAHRLTLTNARLANKQSDTRLFFIISADDKVGATTIASALALTIAASTKTTTAYIEFPQFQLPNVFGFSHEMESYTHPGEYQVLNPKPEPNLSQSAQATMLMDRTHNRFKNIVVCVKWELAIQLESHLRNASEFAVISSPRPKSLEHAKNIVDTLKFQMQINKNRLFKIVNHSHPAEDASEPMNTTPDFVLPFLGNLPPISEQRSESLPEPLKKILEEMLNRLGLTSQIGIYIPTTVAIDQVSDTSEHVKKTLAFMGKVFGGATHEQVHGVWNSSESGLVTEDIHLIRSFCSQTALDQKMGSVIDYVESMKQELQQEAMAIEVNQKLMLI